MCVLSCSLVSDFVAQWTVARQAPLSMGLSRQAYWSGLPFPSPGDLPDPGMEPGSPALQADSLPSEPRGKPLCVLAAQACPTLCDPMDCGPPGSSVPGILQARILEWVAIASSRGSSCPRDGTHVSCIGRQILYHCVTWEAPYNVVVRLYCDNTA